MHKIVIVTAIYSYLLFARAQASQCIDFYKSNYKQKNVTTVEKAKLTVYQVLSNSMKAPGIAGYSKVMKVLIDVRDYKNPVLHFINTNDFQYHYDFARSKLNYRKSNEDFNRLNYYGPGNQREFILASVLTNKAKDGSAKSILELFSGDVLDASSLKMVVRLVENSITGFDSFKFHPLSEAQEKEVTQLKPTQVILTRELTANLTYFPFNKGEAVGYIRFVKKEDYESGRVVLDAYDIAVFDQVPNDIGLVAGVVAKDLQTALSHVNVKSINRQTINIYFKDIESLRDFDGKPVRIVANEDGLTPEIINKSTSEVEKMISDFWKARQKKLRSKPNFILTPKAKSQLVDLSNYYQQLPTKAQHQKLIQTVGAKAANLALLKIIVKRNNIKVNVPDAFGLRFDVFDDYLKTQQPGLDTANPNRVMTLKERILELLSSGDLLNSEKIHRAKVVAPILAEVRSVMSRSQVTERIIKEFKTAIVDDLNSPIHISKIIRLRLRSSTNSEDMAGFTGAGLYDSDGINFYKKRQDDSYDITKPRKWEKIEEDLRETIPRLFSSVFNERAFMEREFFGINGNLHNLIMGGLAIHNAYTLKDFEGSTQEHANGVAITTDLYRNTVVEADYPKIFLNSQHYDLAVTNPPTKEELIQFNEDPKRPYTTEEIVITNFFADDSRDRGREPWKHWPYEQVRQSSVKNGSNVISKEEALSLAFALQTINNDMAQVFEVEVYRFPIDAEYKFYGPNRNLIIKQARPFVRPSTL